MTTHNKAGRVTANRLDLETIKQGATTLASYDQFLLPDGQRDYVIEIDENGVRTLVNWVYDDDGRLVREDRDVASTLDVIADDSVFTPNGEGDYRDTFMLDLVGNRLQWQHDAAGTAEDETVISTYNDRDQLTAEDSTIDAHDAGYAYDHNGSQLTKTSNGVTLTYSWSLHNTLVAIDNTSDGTWDIAYAYDAGGVRVSETTADGTTWYLNDAQNPTGYSKPLEERTATDTKSYALGLQVIAQAVSDPAHPEDPPAVQFLLTDGHGSTRLLLSLPGSILERYAYTAFGTLLNFAGTPKTNWLFAGDGIFDPASQLTYHLARWRDGARFIGFDSYETNQALHKYLYANGNPIMNTDPTGNFSLSELISVQGIQNTLNRIYESRPVQILTRGLRNKKWDVYLAGAFIPQNFPTPWHTFIYVDSKATHAGFRFDVGEDPFNPMGTAQALLGFGVGQLRVSPSTLVQIKTTYSSFEFASFNDRQFAVWGAAAGVAALGLSAEDHFTRPLNFARVPYPFTVNCTTWTVAAAGLAFTMQILPV